MSAYTALCSPLTFAPFICNMEPRFMDGVIKSSEPGLCPLVGVLSGQGSVSWWAPLACPATLHALSSLSPCVMCGAAVCHVHGGGRGTQQDLLSALFHFPLQVLLQAEYVTFFVLCFRVRAGTASLPADHGTSPSCTGCGSRWASDPKCTSQGDAACTADRFLA